MCYDEDAYKMRGVDWTMQRYLAFDVGGTTIKYGIVGADQTITHRGAMPTERNVDSAILKRLIKVTRDIKDQISIEGIGVSTAGIVAADGSIQYAGPTIPDYQGTPIKAKIEDVAGIPVHVFNDVDAALLGEQAGGVAKGVDDVYCLALGTGIGGAYSHHGELFSGVHGLANSVGYTLYDPKGKTNYEQRAATLSLQSQLQPYAITVIEAFAQAKAGIEPFVKLLTDWAATVASGLAPIVLLFDPEMLIIGGAVSKQGDYLLSLLNPALDQLLTPHFRQTVLKVAALGNDAQLLGSVVPFLK